MPTKILILIMIVLSMLWLGVSALLVFLASLAFGFKMSLFKVLFVFVAGFVIRGLMPSDK